MHRIALWTISRQPTSTSDVLARAGRPPTHDRPPAPIMVPGRYRGPTRPYFSITRSGSTLRSRSGYNRLLRTSDGSIPLSMPLPPAQATALGRVLAEFLWEIDAIRAAVGHLAQVILRDAHLRGGERDRGVEIRLHDIVGLDEPAHRRLGRLRIVSRSSPC